MALMSLRKRYRIKASMVLTIADDLFIQSYVRSLLNSILSPILMSTSIHTNIIPTYN